MIKRMKLILLGIFIFLPLLAYAQMGSEVREKEIQVILNKMEADLDRLSLENLEALAAMTNQNIKTGDISYKQSLAEKSLTEKSVETKEPLSLSQREYLNRKFREEKMQLVMRNLAIEISLEYFMASGNQIFEIITQTEGRKLSKLDYPIKGQIPVVKGEVSFLPRVSVGGKFATSSLRKGICSDEDWGFWGRHNMERKYIDYQITRQQSKSKVEFFDLNLYYNLLDSAKEEDNENTLYSNLLIDKFSLDIFAGYQSYKGRYRMIDPMTELLYYVEGSWWYSAPGNIGLNSFYKIEYTGPRLGTRITGSKGKVTSKVSLCLAYLKTKAYGWWNLREYSFWQRGKSGLGTDFDFETIYRFNPFFSCGFGYNYSGYYQKKLKASGIQPSLQYDDLDIVRNADCKIYGPKFILRYIW